MRSRGGECPIRDRDIHTLHADEPRDMCFLHRLIYCAFWHTRRAAAKASVDYGYEFKSMAVDPFTSSEYLDHNSLTLYATFLTESTVCNILLTWQVLKMMGGAYDWAKTWRSQRFSEAL